MASHSDPFPSSDLIAVAATTDGARPLVEFLASSTSSPVVLVDSPHSHPVAHASMWVVPVTFDQESVQTADLHLSALHDAGVDRSRLVAVAHPHSVPPLGRMTISQLRDELARWAVVVLARHPAESPTGADTVLHRM
jgi:hypothetical protein